MALHGFDKPSMLVFAGRASVLVVLGFMAGLLAAELGGESMEPRRSVVKSTIAAWSSIPDVCWQGNAVSDFQKNECEKFWERLVNATVYSSLPLFFALVAWLASVSQFRRFYIKSRLLIEGGIALFEGVVTEPAEAPGDRFSWFYCLRPVSIQLKDRRQMIVHVPLDVPVPVPGQKLAVFKAGDFSGRKRFIGVINAPHLAVVG